MVQSAIAARLPLVPRYRQKVRFVPLALGRPTWVDDPHFNLDYHVRRTALPAPGGDEELRNLVGRVMSQQLDRAKPLWEMWVVEGLDDGRWALISKTHHCMVDGVSGTDLLSVILSSDRDPARRRSTDDWQPTPEPNSAELVDALAGAARGEPVRGGCDRCCRPRAVRDVSPVRRVDTARGCREPRTAAQPSAVPARSTARSARTDAGTGRGRGCRTSSRSAQRHGGTINDVVLAVITNGFRELLLSAARPSRDACSARSCPSRSAPTSERGTYNNKVSAMFAELPVEIEDPVERLHSLHEQMQQLKHSGQAVAAERLTALGGFAPAMLLALGGRVGTRLPQSSVNTVTTNVPGPQHPLYLARRRMLEAFPFVPLGGHVRVGVAIFSYDGGINFGVTGDCDTAPDIGVLCRGIEHGVAELMGAPSPKPDKRRAATGARS